MTTATSKCAVSCATWKNPRSQLVPPPEVRPSIQVLTWFAPPRVDTGVNGRFLLLVVLAGALELNSASWDGVPISELVKVFAAAFRLGRSAPTEPETSSTSATSRPH